jgi:Casein kinase II regulatory subunit
MAPTLPIVMLVLQYLLVESRRNADLLSDSDYTSKIVGYEEDDILFGDLSEDEYEERIVNSLMLTGEDDVAREDLVDDDDEYQLAEADVFHRNSVGYRRDDSVQARKVFRERNQPPVAPHYSEHTKKSKPVRTTAASVTPLPPLYGSQRQIQYMPLSSTYQFPLPSTTTATVSSTVPTQSTPPSRRDTHSVNTSSKAEAYLGSSDLTNPLQTTLSPRQIAAMRETSAPTGPRYQQQQAVSEAIMTPWVRQFFSSCHRDVLFLVPKDFCVDVFNLIHLPPIIERIGQQRDTASLGDSQTFPIYKQALKLITQEQPIPANLPKNIDTAARALYLLLHQRYVLSPRGLDMVRRRLLLKSPTCLRGYSNKNESIDPIFGRCPVLECRGMPLLPTGEADEFYVASDNSHGNEVAEVERRAKRYCASCRQIFYHWESKVDGCAWGTSFCHLFLLVYGAEVFGKWYPSKQRERVHVARIFGFPLHPNTGQ